MSSEPILQIRRGGRSPGSARLRLLRRPWLFLGLLAALGPAKAAWAQTTGTTWSALVLVYPNTDADYQNVDSSGIATGAILHFTSGPGTELSPAVLQGIRSAAQLDFPQLVAEWSNGMSTVSVTVRVISRPITQLENACGGWWPSSADAATELDPELATGRWDSVFAIWNPGGVIPRADGCSNSSSINRNGHDFTWSTLPGDEDFSHGGLQNSGEPFVHEWLHPLSGFYNQLGYRVEDPDNACTYPGYCPVPNPGGTAEPFYRANLQGTLIGPAHEYIGTSRSVWLSGAVRSGTQRRPLPVQLLSPVDGTCASTTPTLHWTAFPSQPYDGYLVSVYDVGNPAVPAIPPVQTTLDTWTVPSGSLDPARRYRWEVQTVQGSALSPHGDALSFDPISTVALPTFAPAAGPLPSAGFGVAISSATSDAVVRYTTDGSDPTSSDPVLAPGATVTVVPPATLKARAFATAACANDSPVAAASYTVAQPLVVSRTDDTGADTLRQAILTANAQPGRDVIEFALPGPGVQTIAPQSALPTITDPVFLDATTQPGYGGSPLVELDGGAAGSTNGLTLTAGASVVRGLAIHGFAGDGIALVGGGGSTVQGCFIGTGGGGSTASPNGGNGISVAGSPDNLVGGSGSGEGNQLSGNGTRGLDISGSLSSGNRVVGNLIGTDVSGMQGVPNALGGIRVAGAADNTIGGADPADRNVISGNGFSGASGDGVAIVDVGATGNAVLGNYIGVDASGDGALGNSRFGVAISYTTGSSTVSATGNAIGGTQPGAGNVVSGNLADGVAIISAQSGGGGNVVQGNLIGTDAGGSIALGNGGNGVTISGSIPGSPTPSGNLVGGILPEARNVISGNAVDGVAVIGASLGANLVQGNYIGTDAAGSSALGNGRSGVRLTTATPISDSAAHNQVGGLTFGAGNVISGNLQAGVAIIGKTTGATDNRVQGNRIGLDATGSSGVGNGGDGVLVTTLPAGGAAPANQIGGSEAGAGNWIGANAQAGVRIEGAATGNNVWGNTIGLGMNGEIVGNLADGVVVDAPGNSVGSLYLGTGNAIARNGGDGVRVASGDGNSILGNGITTNAGLGIDLAGGNSGASPPALLGVQTDVATTVLGSLQGAPNASYEVQYFSDSVCDPSGAGEGATYLGTLPVTTDGTGLASANVGLPSPLPVGSVVTATSTDAAGSTSAFSTCSTVSASDTDGDGLPFGQDNCPFVSNPQQQDGDGDGVGDACDDCTAVADGPLAGPVNQLDTDGDGYGNVCDCDFDQDGACGIGDFNVFLPDFAAGHDSGTGTDMNGDHAVNIGDFNLFLPGFTAGHPGPKAP